jgi:RNA polymerase sigma-70 factor (ECF subfamily)
MLAERTETVPYRAEVRAARRGDRSAFEALVRSVQRSVYGLCLRLLRTEAEAAEVAQETFLRAYQHLGRYDESKPFDLWVLAIARNLCLDLLRRRSRVHTQDVDEIHEALPPARRARRKESSPPRSTAASRPRSPPWARTTRRSSRCTTCRSAPRRRSPR